MNGEGRKAIRAARVEAPTNVNAVGTLGTMFGPGVSGRAFVLGPRLDTLRPRDPPPVHRVPARSLPGLVSELVRALPHYADGSRVRDKEIEDVAGGSRS